MRTPPIIAILAPMLASLAPLAQAADIVVERQGPSWATVTSGTLPVPAQPRIHVSARGKVIVRGGSTASYTYKLTRRIVVSPIARDEDSARRLIGDARMGLNAPGAPTALLAVALTPRVPLESVLELTIPKQTSLTVVESPSGSVETYDLDGNVEVTTQVGEIKADRIQGGLSARTGGGEIHIGKVGGVIRCSSGAGSIVIDIAGPDTNCSTMAGGISLRESPGFVTLSSAGGNISIERAAAAVNAHTQFGSIEIGQAGATVTAIAQGGFIQIGSAKGVHAESANGSVRVKSVDGPMQIAVGLGSIFADLVAGAHLAQSSLVATSGDITLGLPSNLAVTVMARNETGGNPGIVSDFPEFRAKSIGFVVPPVVVRGDLGGGGPLMSLNTAGGSIYIRRTK